MLREKVNIIAFLLVPVLVLSLSACLRFETSDSSPSDFRDTWPTIDEVEFFDTPKEAIENNLLFEHGLVKADEVLRMFKGEEYVVVIFTSQVAKGGDLVSAFLGYYKEEEGKFRYSASFSGMDFPCLMHNLVVRGYGLDEIGEIRYGFTAYNLDQQFAVDETKRFYWGFSHSPNVKYLRVDGQLVDGVIPVELNGETVYVWHFEDLRTENSLSFRDYNQQGEGEAVITMTPE